MGLCFSVLCLNIPIWVKWFISTICFMFQHYHGSKVVYFCIMYYVSTLLWWVGSVFLYYVLCFIIIMLVGWCIFVLCFMFQYYYASVVVYFCISFILQHYYGGAVAYYLSCLMFQHNFVGVFL